jgi:hypothetical protein
MKGGDPMAGSLMNIMTHTQSSFLPTVSSSCLTRGSIMFQRQTVSARNNRFLSNLPKNVCPADVIRGSRCPDHVRAIHSVKFRKKSNLYVASAAEIPGSSPGKTLRKMGKTLRKMRKTLRIGMKRHAYEVRRPDGR